MPISIFIASDAEDNVFLAELKNHFTPLTRNSDIVLWDESQVQAGEDFEAIYEQQLKAADVVLFLVSADFMATKMHTPTLQLAFNRLNNKEISLVPVIVRACSWELEPVLQGLKILPNNGTPLNKWEDLDEAYNHLVQEFQKIVADVQNLKMEAENKRLYAEKITKYATEVIDKDILADTLRQKISALYQELDAAKAEEAQNFQVRKEMWQVLDAYYNDNLSLYQAQGYTEILPFCEGFSAVKKEEKWGFIDKTGQVVIPCEYEHVGSFREGLAVVEKTGTFGFIDKKGQIAIPFQYNHALSFVEGMSAVKVGEHYGFIDKTGRIAIPIHYHAAWHFSEGIAAVQRYNKWGFVDTTGTRITPLQYDLVQVFKEGLAAVMKENQWGFIDKEGNITIPLIYNEAKSFSKGIASVLKGENWVNIDKEGIEQAG